MAEVAGGDAVKTLFAVFRATEQSGQAKDEQDIADDRTGNRGLYHTR